MIDLRGINLPVPTTRLFYNCQFESELDRILASLVEIIFITNDTVHRDWGFFDLSNWKLQIRYTTPIGVTWRPVFLRVASFLLLFSPSALTLSPGSFLIISISLQDIHLQLSYLKPDLKIVPRNTDFYS